MNNELNTTKNTKPKPLTTDHLQHIAPFPGDLFLVLAEQHIAFGCTQFALIGGENAIDLDIDFAFDG